MGIKILVYSCLKGSVVLKVFFSRPNPDGDRFLMMSVCLSVGLSVFAYKVTIAKVLLNVRNAWVELFLFCFDCGLTSR